MSETRPDVKQKIRRQVEFYFSDSNLPFDKFLWTQAHKDPEGWVSLETIANFKKMQWYTKDFATVIEALKEQPSDLIELDEEGKRVRRKTEVAQKKIVPCSIYAKGFPLVDEGAENPLYALFELQDEIEDLFNQHGKVASVRLRKQEEKPYKFKGSAYIEFETPEKAEEVAKKSIKYKDTDLLLKTKVQYLDEKAALYKDQPQSQGKKRKIVFNAFKPNKQPRFNDKKGKKNKKPTQAESEQKSEEKQQDTKAAETAPAETNAADAATSEKAAAEINNASSENKQEPEKQEA